VSLTPEDFPRLAVFLRSAFDLGDGRSPRTAVEAVYRYLEEAESDELAELWNEWRAFLPLARQLPLPELNRVFSERFRTLYCALSHSDLEEAGRLLERAVTD
jgi:hypothetical protein